MRVIRNINIEYIPASHEDPNDPGVLKKVLVKRGDIEEGRLQMINWSRMPVGKNFSLHYHEDMTEIFIIMEGSVEIEMDGEKENLEKGDGVIIPAMAKHQMWNRSENDSYYLAMGIAHGEDGKTINC